MHGSGPSSGPRGGPPRTTEASSTSAGRARGRGRAATNGRGTPGRSRRRARESPRWRGGPRSGRSARERHPGCRGEPGREQFGIAHAGMERDRLESAIGKTPGQQHGPLLGKAVGRVPVVVPLALEVLRVDRPGREAGDRDHVHEAARRTEQGCESAGDTVRREHVDRERGLEPLGRQHPLAQEDPGVVDKHLKLAMAFAEVGRDQIDRGFWAPGMEPATAPGPFGGSFPCMITGRPSRVGGGRGYRRYALTSRATSTAT